MHQLIALSDWFLDRSTFKSLRDRIRGRTFILVVVLALLTNASLGLLLRDQQAYTWFRALFCSQMLCLIGMLVYTRLSGHYRSAAVIHFVTLHIHVCLVMYQAESLLSIYYASMGTRVVVASFILGFRLAIPLIVFYGATTAGMVHINADYGAKLPFAQNLQGFAMLLALSLVLAQLAMVFFSWLYHESLQQDYARLKRDRSRLFRSARTFDLSRMLGELNHHINNPLSIVHAHLYRIAHPSRTGPSPIHDYGPDSPSSQAMHKIRFIIEHLKLLAAPESPELETPISVRNLCLNLLTQYQEPCRLQGIDFRFLDQTMNMNFVWRRHELYTILAGLLQNACEAVERSEEKSVLLRIERKEDWLLFTVVDSGPGIPESEKNRLFKPFYSTKAGSNHLGLTLVTSRAQLEDRGGFIRCENVEPGASFQVGLPIPR